MALSLLFRHLIERLENLGKVGPLLGVLLETGANQNLQGRWTPTGDFRSMVAIQHGQRALDRRHVFVGTLARQELPQNDTVAVNVSLLIVGLIGQDFGSHPLDRAAVSRHAAILCLEAAETEITHLGRVTLVQENVGALQIAMPADRNIYREQS